MSKQKREILGIGNEKNVGVHISALLGPFLLQDIWRVGVDVEVLRVGRNNNNELMLALSILA